MAINCIIVDDEFPAIAKIKHFVARLPELKLIGTFESAIEAITFLNTNQVDLVFLDIQMPEINGFELLDTLQCKPRVIVVSGYQENAVRSYNYNVDDFLLKPFDFPRFLKAVNISISNINLMKVNGLETLYIKDKGVIERVNFEDINYIKSDGDYLKIYTDSKTYIVNQTLKEIVEKLPTALFIRIQKSIIVSIPKITSIEEGTLLINKSQRLPVGEKFRKSLLEKLTII